MEGLRCPVDRRVQRFEQRCGPEHGAEPADVGEHERHNEHRSKCGCKDADSRSPEPRCCCEEHEYRRHQLQPAARRQAQAGPDRDRRNASRPREPEHRDHQPEECCFVLPESLADRAPETRAQTERHCDEECTRAVDAPARDQIRETDGQRREQRARKFRHQARCARCADIDDPSLPEWPGDHCGDDRRRRGVGRAVTAIPRELEPGSLEKLRREPDHVVEGRGTAQQQFARGELRRLGIVARDLASVGVVDDEHGGDGAGGDGDVLPRSSGRHLMAFGGGGR